MYSKKTKKINITVSPYFLDDQSEPEDQHFVWAYQVTINNLGKESVQLKNRYWKIIDSNGEKQEVKGDSYINRIKNGVLGDGVNSAIAALFNTFPNTTFSQNNGVIQLTGIASRHVGVWIGGILIVMGLFPHVGSILRALPASVLGGATIVMFGTVAIAGI